ncbi:MAG: hypothetical protein KDJ39_06050 [Gammaproteobacteria bacterium]|nr:hypothetical protein [Gammaproteobacteria bacterium]
MTPADTLTAALDQLRAGIAGLEAEGAPATTRDRLDAVADDLEGRLTDLAYEIYEATYTDGAACAGCLQLTNVNQRHPYSDGAAVEILAECSANTFSCPVVRACGFTEGQ